MAVSIKDIARMAGVSHSTVSRALQRSPLISAETAERIQNIAAQSGYTASAVARGLVTRRTLTLGVVVTRIADPFNGEVVAGIEEVANERGYSVILAASHADPDREVAVVRSFQEHRIDGALVASSRVGALYVQLMGNSQTPIVLINNHHPSAFVHSVSIDNVDGGYQATKHLLDFGHTKIAYIDDEFGLQASAERFQGYAKALSERNIALRPEYRVKGDGKPEGGRQAAKTLFALSDKPTAIFCYNDMSSLGAYREAEHQGLKIPDDLSITGFDDLYFSPYLKPPLTTFHQPKKEIGRCATELLLSMLDGKVAEKNVLLQGKLTVRASSGSPRR